MPIKADYKEFPIEISQGGLLATDLPLHKIRPADFTSLVNLRPVNGCELEKIEGHDYFAPNSAQAALAQRLNAPAGCAAIREISRPNGKSAAVCVAGAKIYAFSFDSGTWSEIGSGYTTGVPWQIEEVAGYAVFNNPVDLMATWQVGDAAVRPNYEFREQGYASCATIGVTVEGILKCMDILEILDAELNGILNGGSPYGPVTDPAKTQRVQFEILWANIGAPRDFAATVDGTGTSGTPNITLVHPMASFAIGDELTVVGGGTAGGNLTTTIANIAGASLTLATNLITSITSQPIQKTTALASIVGSWELEDDGEGITRGTAHKNRFVIVKGSSIFVGYYTGDLDEPFRYERVYTGKSTPRFPRSLVNVDDEYLWWVGEKHFYRFTLGYQQPEIDPVLRAAEKALFFSRIASADVNSVFSAIDATSNEIYLSFPYESSRHAIRRGFTKGEEYAFEVDIGFDCACSIRKPLAGGLYEKKEYWFIFGASDGTIVRNGRSNFEVFTHRRFGSDFYGSFVSGLESFGDGSNEKDIKSFTPLISHPAAVGLLEFTLYGTNNTHQEVETLESKTLNNPVYPGIAHLFYRRNYFQFQLRTRANLGVRISGWIWEVARTASHSAVRTQA
jgi:hypothetical protein